MNKNSLLTLLLISAICLLVNAVAGWLLLNLGGLASAILCLIYILNAKRVFGPEGKNAYDSCLWSLIVNGAIFVLANSIGVLLIVVTLGIWAIISGVVVFLVDIGFGIWQLMAWSKLNNEVKGTPAAV